MATLYELFLPIVQSLNDYGGNFTAHHIRKVVLNAVDEGAAANDPSLVALRAKMLEKMVQWKGLQDHGAVRALFESYYEAVFYLTAVSRGVSLRAIPAGAGRGNTPDFSTNAAPTVNFEVKTIDVANPDVTYDTSMVEGLNAQIEAQERAKITGVGIAGRFIKPHGDAEDRRDAVEQVMKKIASNVKAGQYSAAPTFLVVSLGRTALHERSENLRKWLPWPRQKQNASGQLFAVSAHELDDPFYFFPENGHTITNLGVINRAGILIDHPYIAGLIFLVTEGSSANSTEVVAGVYSLNGIWNKAWENNEGIKPEDVAAAKMSFGRLCHAWNDTEDSRSPLLPTQ